eukprot:888560-Prymnesium_polylepis.1
MPHAEPRNQRRCDIWLSPRDCRSARAGRLAHREHLPARVVQLAPSHVVLLGELQVRPELAGLLLDDGDVVVVDD